MINGYTQLRRVLVGVEELKPGPSQKLVNHSPDGFAWGYPGSGPAQLALALLLHFTDRKFALEHYQQFKFDIIAGLPQGSFSLREQVVRDWLKKNGWQGKS